MRARARDSAYLPEVTATDTKKEGRLGNECKMMPESCEIQSQSHDRMCNKRLRNTAQPNHNYILNIKIAIKMNPYLLSLLPTDTLHTALCYSELVLTSKQAVLILDADWLRPRSTGIVNPIE